MYGICKAGHILDDTIFVDAGNKHTGHITCRKFGYECPI